MRTIVRATFVGIASAGMMLNGLAEVATASANDDVLVIMYCDPHSQFYNVIVCKDVSKDYGPFTGDHMPY